MALNYDINKRKRRQDFKGTLKEEPPKNKKYTEEELWDDPIPF